ncbi:MAG: hypothetical protein ACK4ZM_04770 [bacterium]
MTEINKVNNLSNQQSVINQQNQITTNTNPQNNPTTPNDFININNNPTLPPMLNNIPENPYILNPFYQANQFQTNQAVYPTYAPTYLTSESLVENKISNLGKYLLAGGLGLFTGLMLGSMMPYGYYLQYPMYYSYYYTPCWYNFGWYW